MERRRTWLRFSIVANAALGILLLTMYLREPPLHLPAVVSAGNSYDASYGGGRYDAHPAQAKLQLSKDELDELCPKAVAPPPPPPAAPPATVTTVVTRDAQCGLCKTDAGSKLCKEWGPDVVERSVAWRGTNGRLRRALDKMRRGEDWKMAVIGGSVSAGHGLTEGDHKSGPHNMHAITYEYLKGEFKKSKKTGFTNGAQPAQGSEYFCMCSHLHIPNDADLIVVEVGINSPPHQVAVETYELLIRSLLQRDNGPAVLILNIFALKFENIAMSGDLTYGVNFFYDVPVIDLRIALAPLLWEDPMNRYKWFHNDKEHPDGLDTRHLNTFMHDFCAQLMITYLQNQMCEMDALEKADPKTKYPLNPVPPQRVMGRYTADLVEPKLKPFCKTTNSDSFPLIPSENKGWKEWSSSPEKKYWVSEEPGTTIMFPVSTTRGNIIIQYLRSRTFGLGNANCWLNDHDRDKVLEGYWDEPFNIGRTHTWDQLPPGDYTVTCELLNETADPSGKKQFRIISLMSI